MILKYILIGWLVHVGITALVYIWCQPSFIKIISGTGDNYPLTDPFDLLIKANLKGIEVLLLVVPIANYYSIYMFNKWLSLNLLGNDFYAVKMTLFGPVYYPVVAYKASMINK